MAAEAKSGGRAGSANCKSPHNIMSSNKVEVERKERISSSAIVAVI